MSKEQVIDYVMNSPANTNKAVLEGMLDGMGGANVPTPTVEDAGKVLGVNESGNYALTDASSGNADSIEHIEVKLWSIRNEETGEVTWLNSYTGAELMQMLNDPTKFLDVYIKPEGAHTGRIARAVSYAPALSDFGAPLGFSFTVVSKGDGSATFIVREYYIPNDSTDYQVLRTLKFDKNQLYE